MNIIGKLLLAPIWWIEGVLVFWLCLAAAPFLFLYWLMSAGSAGEFVSAVKTTYFDIPVSYFVRPFLDD